MKGLEVQVVAVAAGLTGMLMGAPQEPAGGTTQLAHCRLSRKDWACREGSAV